MDDELQAVREQLLAHRLEPLMPGQSAAAFQQHVLLALKVHQAARLDAPRRERDGRLGRYTSIRWMEHFDCDR